MYKWLLAFHIIAVISWMAGVLYLYRLIIYHVEETEAVVRERFKIRRQVRVHTAHGRFTGYVLLALPAALAIALSFINPEHMQTLFRERMGQMMLLGAMVMQTIGFIWIRQVIKIEV